MLKQKLVFKFLLEILYSLLLLFFFRPFFMEAVCPRKTTLPSMPVIGIFKHLKAV